MGWNSKRAKGRDCAVDTALGARRAEGKDHGDAVALGQSVLDDAVERKCNEQATLSRTKLRHQTAGQSAREQMRQPRCL